jgi:NAD(P)H-quinone oxidoreductase subunit 5
LNASSTVKDCDRKLITGEVHNSGLSMIAAVPIALVIVFGVQYVMGNHVWPWWWTVVLAFAWAPMLWVPKVQQGRRGVVLARITTGLAIAAFLTLAAGIMDRAPIGAGNDPLTAAGIAALIGMGAMYLAMTIFQLWPQSVVAVRRWVYAGFYMDEGYTHWVLRLWPAHWAGAGRQPAPIPWISAESACGRPEA